MPIYNAEKFLEKKFNSLLSQTYDNFELIISDNASTDNTQKICMEYQQKDKRIKYIRQEKNMGPFWNLSFVLNEAKCEYFLWTAADDIFTLDFLEKTIHVLSSDAKIVGVISKIESSETIFENIEHEKIDLIFKKIVKKMRCSTRTRDAFSIKGSFENKARQYLRKSTCQVIYSLFRTKQLRNSFVNESFLGTDWMIFLNILKHGELHVIDELLMQEYEGGISGRGILNSLKYHNQGKIGKIFPWSPLTIWSIRNLGIKFFLHNLDYYIQLNLEGIFSILIDIMQRGIKIPLRK